MKMMMMMMKLCISSLPPLHWWSNGLSFELYMSHNRSAVHLRLHQHTAPSLPPLCLSTADTIRWCVALTFWQRMCRTALDPPEPPHKTPAGCLQFIRLPLPLMEYFTHLSKQITWVQTDVRGANRIATGQRILFPQSFTMTACVCVVLYVCIHHTPAMLTPMLTGFSRNKVFQDPGPLIIPCHSVLLYHSSQSFLTLSSSLVTPNLGFLFVAAAA